VSGIPAVGWSSVARKIRGAAHNVTDVTALYRIAQQFGEKVTTTGNYASKAASGPWARGARLADAGDYIADE
jgi:hypothetical protein